MYWNRSGKFEYICDVVDGLIKHKFYIDGKCVALPTAMFGKAITVKQLLSESYGFWGPENPDRDELVWDLATKPVKTKKIWDLDSNPAKKFYKYFGVKPSAAVKYINGAVYCATIKPYIKYSDLWRVGKKPINIGVYKCVVQNWDLIQQAEKDGLKHLVPFIALTGLSPQELRKLYGKGLWKKISGNSYTRNVLLAKKGVFSEVVEKIVDIPSTLLKTPKNPNILHWIAKTENVPLKSTLNRSNRDYRLLYDQVSDCMRMKSDLGQPFSFSWSRRRMVEEHENATRHFRQMREERWAKQDAEYKKRLNKAQTRNLSDTYKTTNWDSCGVTANLLTTYDEIIDEGNKMHHCVGSYAMQSMEGEYLVLHLEGDNYKSTVGLHRTGASKALNSSNWSIQQHYGVCNDYKVPESHKELVHIALKDLNDKNNIED